jgi:uncharacterized repeat protein (TIGR01451 family)
MNAQKTFMKLLRGDLLRYAALWSALSVVVTVAAPAAGTPAGTVIRSRSTATYTTQSGAQIDTAYSAYVSFAVAQHAALNLAPASAAATAGGGGASADYALTLVNSGNGSDKIVLSAHSSKGWTAAVYADANGNGVLEANELSAGPVAQTPDLAADAAYPVILRLTVPSGQRTNGEKDTTILQAQSVFASSVTAQGEYTTTIEGAYVNGVLTADKPVPNQGETVSFTCTFTNTGAVRAQNVVVSDLITTGFSFVSASGGTVNSTANPITWSVGAIDPGASATVQLTLRVNLNAVPGTVLFTQMSAGYTTPTGSYSVESNLAQVTVGAAALKSVTITPLSLSASGECMDTIAYRYRLTNTGTQATGIQLNASSSKNFLWSFYRDGNNDGRWDKNDPQISNGASTASIDTVAAGDSVRIFAVAVLPRVAIDQTKDSLHVSAAPSSGGTESAATTVVTTINVPNVVVAMSISPSGNHPSGSELTYTIAYSNSGHAAVDNFSVVDTAPQYTEYVANSIKVDGIAVFDNEGQANVTTDAEHNTVIAVSVGKLSGSRNGSVEFKVKVK